ncbi:MAG TPA: hypothetical protein PLG47_03655, partial [Candidatus Dojkabacteria bacterium]|nr:hypothetical protein [Candidatus Dojkabacteria bacterium]
ESSEKSVLINYGDVRYDLYSNSNNITRHSHRDRINVTPKTKYEDIFTVVSPYTNRLKSAIGNNGMFDMTNPNIYKGIIPPALLLYPQSQQQNKTKQNKTKQK